MKRKRLSVLLMIFVFSLPVVLAPLPSAPNHQWIGYVKTESGNLVQGVDIKLTIRNVSGCECYSDNKISTNEEGIFLTLTSSAGFIYGDCENITGMNCVEDITGNEMVTVKTINTIRDYEKTVNVSESFSTLFGDLIIEEEKGLSIKPSGGSGSASEKTEEKDEEYIDNDMIIVKHKDFREQQINKTEKHKKFIEPSEEKPMKRNSFLDTIIAISVIVIVIIVLSVYAGLKKHKKNK